MAMGCMGMSYEDFARCTPLEYAAVWRAWHEAAERREQSEWERLRMSCLCMLQPYSKKRLRAEDVMRFPWETESRGSAVSHRGQSNNITLSAEEMEARREAAIARYGLK